MTIFPLLAELERATPPELALLHGHIEEKAQAELRVRMRGAEQEMQACLQRHAERLGRAVDLLIDEMPPALLAELHAIHHRWSLDGRDGWLAQRCHCASCTGHRQRGWAPPFRSAAMIHGGIL